MARLIDAMQIVTKLSARILPLIRMGANPTQIYNEMLQVLAEAPTVDAVPVVHGRWIPTYHTYYNRDGECKIADEWHCSVCEIYSKEEWNYCPNCGAKMDLEVKDA